MQGISAWQSQDTPHIPSQNSSTQHDVNHLHHLSFVVQPKCNKDVASSRSGQAAAQHCDMLKHLDSHLVKGSSRPVADTGGVSSASCERRGVDVERMGKEEMEEVKRLLTEAEEVAMTLVYNDGTTQLRNLDVC